MTKLQPEERSTSQNVGSPNCLVQGEQNWHLNDQWQAAGKRVNACFGIQLLLLCLKLLNSFCISWWIFFLQCLQLRLDFLSLTHTSGLVNHQWQNHDPDKNGEDNDSHSVVVAKEFRQPDDGPREVQNNPAIPNARTVIGYWCVTTCGKYYRQTY